LQIMEVRRWRKQWEERAEWKKWLRRLKPTVGCNASKRRRRMCVCVWLWISFFEQIIWFLGNMVGYENMPLKDTRAIHFLVLGLRNTASSNKQILCYITFDVSRNRGRETRCSSRCRISSWPSSMNTLHRPNPFSIPASVPLSFNWWDFYWFFDFKNF
jgi:hypothetical protein